MLSPSGTLVCVKFVLKLCYRQHIVTDCSKCKRLSARAIDYMRQVHCSDGTAGDRGAGQCCVTVVLHLSYMCYMCNKCNTIVTLMHLCCNCVTFVR